MKVKVLELFSGIRATSKALTNLGIEHETTTVEFDKKVQSVANKLWNTNEPTRDVSTFEVKENEYDLVVGGFPCQPFSNAGKRLGFDDPRGKLFKDTLRIIEQCKPKYVILENVKGILQEKNKWIVEEIVSKLDKLGYYVHTQVINAKNYIPQNRERVFIIASMVNEVKPLDVKKEHNLVLGDFLEEVVDEKYYYDVDKLEKIANWKSQERPLKKSIGGVHNESKQLQQEPAPGTAAQILVSENIKNISPSGHSAGKVYDINGIAPTIRSNHGRPVMIDETSMEKYIEKNNVDAVKKGETYYHILSDGTLRPFGVMKDGNLRLPLLNYNTGNMVNVDYTNAITTSNKIKLLDKRTNIPGLFHNSFNAENYITPGGGELGTITASGANSRQKVLLDDLRIRTITPRETLRLMGWEDKWIDNIIDLPKSHLYHVAGNSMVVQVMEKVLESLKIK